MVIRLTFRLQLLFMLFGSNFADQIIMSEPTCVNVQSACQLNLTKFTITAVLTNASTVVYPISAFPSKTY
ncbi:hypothetical protein L596_026164 [Steinernema carpocapsae]|uniref:MSP domain-containing protein n=1 Tax=Steinernema carpocapsae TaxID=34508 RepID=A0A4U5M0K4_STECR|nr:hypothetical protein L596_026164 [Steinernema carpocapsae]